MCFQMFYGYVGFFYLFKRFKFFLALSRVVYVASDRVKVEVFVFVCFGSF